MVFVSHVTPKLTLNGLTNKENVVGINITKIIVPKTYDRTKIYMPFGMFADIPISDVPTWYLDRAVDWVKARWLFFAIVQELQARQDYHEIDYDCTDEAWRQ